VEVQIVWMEDEEGWMEEDGWRKKRGWIEEEEEMNGGRRGNEWRKKRR